MSDTAFSRLVDEFAEIQPEEISVSTTQKIQDLARELIEKTAEANRLAGQLKELNKRINQLKFRELPDLFNEQNMTVHGEGGVELHLQPYYRASLSAEMAEEDKEAALQYLREVAPELIKKEFVLEYPAQQHEIAEQALALLRSLDFDPIVKENVHHSTLTSWVKNRFLAGEEIPLKLLNATVGSHIVITRSDPSQMELLKRVRDAQEARASMSASIDGDD